MFDGDWVVCGVFNLLKYVEGFIGIVLNSGVVDSLNYFGVEVNVKRILLLYEGKLSFKYYIVIVILELKKYNE